MSREILEAMTALAREKGIAPEKLMTRSRTRCSRRTRSCPAPPATRASTSTTRPATSSSSRYRIPKDLEAELIVETIEEESYIDPETGDRVEPQDPEIDPGEVRAVPRPDRGDRRHARGLRPHRRADRQAGDPAADPRGRARHDVRGVPRPRRRADHRHRPAVRLPLHARPAARARRGAAAARPSRSTASATTTASASRP